MGEEVVVLEKGVVRSAVAELIGTFWLIFIGGGAVAADTFFKPSGAESGPLGLVGVALAHGLALMCIVYAIGHISGAHVNPAVTVSMFLTGNIKASAALAYIISQLVGAVLGGLLLRVIFPESGVETAFLGTPDLGAGVKGELGVLVELVLTFFLVFTIFGIAVDERSPKNMAGVAIGLVLTFDILMGGNFTGASMNPARTFGPAVASGHFANHWVYWVGPILGGILAGWIYQFVLIGKKASA